MKDTEKIIMAPIQGWGFPCGSAGKESACNAGDLGLIPGFDPWVWSSGLGRSPGEGKGYQLQYSGLENPMDYPWVSKSRTQLSYFHFHFSPHTAQASILKAHVNHEIYGLLRDGSLKWSRDNRKFLRLKTPVLMPTVNISISTQGDPTSHIW